MVVTSPPYNVQMDYGNGHTDSLPYQKYFAWCQQWINESARVLEPSGRMAVNIPNMGNTKQKKGDGLQTYVDRFMPMCRSAGLTVRDVIVWVKAHKPYDPDSFCGRNSAWGSWQSPSNPFCRSYCELVLVCHKGLPARIKRPDLGRADITRKEFLEYSQNVWFIPADPPHDGHPAPFPVELPYRLIKFYTYQNDVVLDPFAGLGATLVAAEMTRRRWIGFEQNASYIKTARKRIRKWDGQSKLEDHIPLSAFGYLQ